MRLVCTAVLTVAVATPAVLLAQMPGQQPRDAAADSIDFSERELKELPLQLPAAPKPDALIAFDPRRPTAMKFFVDPASVAVGTDGIVRYTLVARGDGTAMNVSYEGIRCETREHRTYAYGRADGTWYQPKDPRWTKIGGAPGPVFALYEDFFCPGRAIVSTAVEAVEGLRLGAHPRSVDLLTGQPIRR